MSKLGDDCTRFGASLTAYVDGELDPDHAVDIESHVNACESCTERVAFTRALRASLKRTSSRRASDTLRERIAGAMATEAKRAAPAAPVPLESRGRVRYAVGFAAAAGILLAMGLTRNARLGGALTDARVPPPSATPSATAGMDTLLDELVALHAEPLPPETKNPEELTRFDPLVGVPVRRPAFHPFNATFDGARLHAMRDRRRAALLQYTLANHHRVTVYVFDPQKVPVKAAQLEPRVVRERPVYVGTMRGYSVAAAEKAGIGYALATDLDSEESAELVLAAVR